MRRRVAESLAQDSSPENYDRAYATFLDYCNDCNPNWARVLNETHPTRKDQHQFVTETINERLYIWMAPGIKDRDCDWIMMMRNKWNINKSRVTFTSLDETGTPRRITTKIPVMIGSEYLYLLYKMPHLRCTNIGHINQYHSPGRVNAQAKLEYPIPQTANRLGEDEVRNLVMAAGPHAASYIMCVYSNSFDGVMNLGSHLLFDKSPSKLENVDLSLPELLNSNNTIRLAQYIFSCMGINVSPSADEVQYLTNELSKSALDFEDIVDNELDENEEGDDYD